MPDPLAAARRLFRRVFPHRPPDSAELWRAACTKWVVGSAQTAEGRLVAHGWLTASPALRPHVGFRVNGRSFDQVDYPLPRPDVLARHSYADGAKDSGFVLITPSRDDEVDLELTAVDERTGAPLGWDYAPVFVPAASRAGPLPSTGQVARVIGTGYEFEFRMGGYTAFRRIEQAIRDAAGEPPTAFPRVLDWGCGCGRVSRYFLSLPGIRVTGVDVDPDNVGWCRSNLPAGTWDVVSLRPPTILPTAGFDLVFGVSVFTHLKEPDQFAWLGELQRVVRPGGLALMTFHGDASVVWSGLTAERYAELRRAGLCDLPNPLYDADLPESDYYRDTFHTVEYIRRQWGRYFDVLSIHPSFITHQDLAVMRRR